MSCGTDLRGKRVLAVGLARTGVATALFCAARGARVTATDTRNESEIGDAIGKLRDAGISLELGGHQERTFLEQDLIIPSPGVPADEKHLQAARGKGIAVWSEIELAYRFLKGRLVGITGSNGKTTTTSLVEHILRKAGMQTILAGNIGTPLIGTVEAMKDETWTVVELSSFTTVQVSSFIASTVPMSGVPMLPARIVCIPAFLRMSSTSEVVVVLPFEPVMPTSRPFRNRYANSISLHTAIPFPRAACKCFSSAGTPGLGMMRSCSKKVLSWWPPSSSEIPASLNFPIASPISLSLRVSVAVTRAPRAAQKRAVATPVRASPTASTRFPRKSVPHDIESFRPRLAPQALYLNFNVVSANNANTRASIQKRTMTFDSLHPNSSKW